jgi:D-glycero-D-manno-heptose 1,7-bisphosphate phosphatase
MTLAAAGSTDMAPPLRPAVFVDRDGVINAAIIRSGKPYSPMSLDQLRILPGVAEGCSRLRDAGFAVVAITNQPEVARGRLDSAALEAMHEAITEQVPLDAIYTCPHDDLDRCSCRKPAPGLIVEACETLGINPTDSYLVGDRWRDIDAGRRAGCTTVLVESGYREPTSKADKTVASLLEAADWIIERRGKDAVP